VGAARGHGGLAVQKSLAAESHGVFKQALSAEPEGLKPFPKRSLKKLLDSPNYLWYVSGSDGNHANAGAARGHRRGVKEGRRKNVECRMKSGGRGQNIGWRYESLGEASAGYSAGG
jgi:hypothetical protein